MLSSLLRTVAIATSVLVVLGFAMFAVDQSSDASRGQTDKLADITPTASTSADVKHTGLRGAIDRADDVLLAPFKIDANSDWVSHAVPALLALLLYGVGLGFLARWTEMRL